MIIMSYNILGMRKGRYGAPRWKKRKENLKRILKDVLKTGEVDVACFQEVNALNLNLLKDILEKRGYEVLKLFPMQSFLRRQYNLIAVKKGIKVSKVEAIPHNEDKVYKTRFNQRIYFSSWEYRTTVFAKIEVDDNKYMVGNIHADHRSRESRERGIKKSLEYLENHKDCVGILVGDMNTYINSDNKEYLKSLNPNYEIYYNRNRHNLTFFRYDGTKKGTLDFAFIDKIISEVKLDVVKQSSVNLEGSDHRPLMIKLGG